MSAVAVCSSGGALGRVNQDAACAIWAKSTLGDIGMAVVCDGVGGLAHGQKASATVAHAFYRWFKAELPGYVAHRRRIDLDAVQTSWQAVLVNLNGMLRMQGAELGSQMGTTFTGLLACGGEYLVGHVGDSRAYRIARDCEEQLTEDQTLAVYLQRQGRMVTGNALEQVEGHAILQAVGAADKIDPVFCREAFEKEDRFVLCTDGAYRTLRQGDLNRTFFENTTLDDSMLSEACKDLVQTCMRRGELDNVTVACLGLQPCDDSVLTMATGGGRP